LVDADQPPLRLLLGSRPLPLIEKVYAGRLETWKSWQDVSIAAQGTHNGQSAAA